MRSTCKSMGSLETNCRGGLEAEGRRKGRKQLGRDNKQKERREGRGGEKVVLHEKRIHLLGEAKIAEKTSQTRTVRIR